MKIHREGKGILTKLGLILVAINGALYMYNGDVVLWSVLLSVIAFVLVLQFFRLPYRRFEGDATNLVIAPVDGKVVAIEEVFEPEHFNDKRLMIAIFMTPLNVHANWYPVNGTVKSSKHHNGRFQAAYLPKSSTENERSTIVIELPDGREVLTRQIAGALAKRIVTYAKPGDKADVNQQLGFIKFGSRMDIYLPIGTEVNVTLGQKTTATQTIVAKLK